MKGVWKTTSSIFLAFVSILIPSSNCMISDMIKLSRNPSLAPATALYSNPIPFK